MALNITGAITPPGTIGTIKSIGTAEVVKNENIVLRPQWNRRMSLNEENLRPK